MPYDQQELPASGRFFRNAESKRAALTSLCRKFSGGLLPFALAVARARATKGPIRSYSGDIILYGVNCAEDTKRTGRTRRGRVPAGTGRVFTNRWGQGKTEERFSVAAARWFDIRIDSDSDIHRSEQRHTGRREIFHKRTARRRKPLRGELRIRGRENHFGGDLPGFKKILFPNGRAAVLQCGRGPKNNGARRLKRLFLKGEKACLPYSLEKETGCPAGLGGKSTG